MAVEQLAAAGGGFFGGPAGVAAVAGGSELLSQLANRLFSSGDRKRLRRFAEQLQSQIGGEVLTDEQLEAMFNNIRRSQAPSFNRAAEGISKRLGLDSGIAQGELARGIQSTEYGIRGNLQQLAARLKSSRDNTLIGTVGNIRAQLARG